MRQHKFLLAVLATAGLTNITYADMKPLADRHAPIGVMGDHKHASQEWMFSYRFMTMDMDGNLDGSDDIGPDTIVTTIPNRFFGAAGQPPTLRIVPTDMQMDMHMFGAMYAPSDKLTLMFMLNYWEKSMNHITYMGGMGTTPLGTFKTETSGLGDSSVQALYGLVDTASTKIHAIAGLSLPTGDTDEIDDILTPMNIRPTIRVPYPMQLGSGSYDPIVGLSYAGFGDRFAWGSQWRSTFRISDNDDDYQLGDEHRLTGWISYRWTDAVSGSLRLEHFRRGNISGQDPEIAGPVQTADPDRQEVKRTDLAFGINLAGQGSLKGWRIGLEYIEPIDQDLDGPQLETDSQLILGIQRAIK